MNKRLATIAVAPDATLRCALTAIDRGGVRIALVVDDNGVLVGTLTDGDIRRALLGGATLEDRVVPFVQRHFTAVSPETSRNEVLDLMQARALQQIPVLDGSRRLVGLHLLREILGRDNKPNWAVVMAGGRGERLRPLTDSIPKPMVQVAGRPVLERIVLHLVGQGLTKVFLSVNYMSDVIEKHFGDGSSLGCEIHYLKEKKPLGTGGALALLPGPPQHPILAINGDLLTQFDAGPMLEFHTSGEFLVTVGCHDYVHTVPYGVLDIAGSRLTGIREKPRVAWSVNAGIYVLDPSLLSRVPRDTYFPLPALVDGSLDRGEPVGVYRVAGDWIDVGLHSDLRRARGQGENT